MKQERKKIKNFVTHCQQVNNVMTHIKGTPMTSNDYIYIGIMERKPIVQEYKPR